MQTQLATSTVPVFRHEAVSPQTLKDRCDYIYEKDWNQAKTNGETAYFCSHWSLWKKLSEDHSTPPFVVTMEDDLIDIPPNWTQQVESFLKSDCAAEDMKWDIIAVDTHYAGRGAAGGNEGRAKCTLDGKMLKLKTTGGFGAHMLIFRTDSLAKLLEKDPKMKILDDWPSMHRKQGINVKFWFPQMVKQASKGPGSYQPMNTTRCDASIRKTDLHAIAFSRNKQLFSCP